MTKMGSCYCDDYDGGDGGGGGDYHFQDDEEEDDVDNDNGPRGIEPCQNCFQHSQGLCIVDCEVSRGDPLGHPMAHLHAVPQPTAKQNNGLFRAMNQWSMANSFWRFNFFKLVGA